MRLLRTLLVLGGLAAMTFGALRLLEVPDLVRAVGPWYVVPVLVHDGLLAPAAVLFGWLGSRLLPASARGPAAAGLLAVAALTAVALVAFLRPRPLPATLLDRDYVAGYVGAVLVVGAAVLLAASVNASRRRRQRRQSVSARTRTTTG